MNNPKKLLVITTAFSPENAVGSIRLTKFVKFLVRKGYQITVISPALHEGSKIDKSLECIELDQVNRIKLPQGTLFTNLFLKKRNQLLTKKSAAEYIKSKSTESFVTKTKAELFRFIQFGYTILRNQDWKRQVIKYANEHFKKNQFDVVFSSYPSLGSPWSAKSLKKNNFAKKWVADFRDPVNYETNSNLFLYFLNSLIQKNIVAGADKITTVTKGIIEKIEKVSSAETIYLPNGIDYDDVPEFKTHFQPAPSDELILCYVGSLYGGERNLSILFKALKELIVSGNILKDNIKFYYAGKEFNILNTQAAQYELSSILIDKGFISRSQSLELQQMADITVIVSWNTKTDIGIVSGKLFECFLTRKTILGIVNGTKPGSELAEMINNVNGGFVIEEASASLNKDFEALKEFLYSQYDFKRNNKRSESTYNYKIDRYSFTNLVDKLDEIFYS